MLALAALFFAHASLAVDFGWENLDLSREEELLSALPQGHGEVIDISLFDGAAAFSDGASSKALLDKAVTFSKAAHEKGYKVAGVVNCFEWTGIKTKPGADKIVEYRVVDAFDKRPEYDFVSPFAPPVQATLLSFTSSLATAKPALDALVLRYTMPLSPVMAFGWDSRREYISAHAIDPVDSAHSESNSDRFDDIDLDYMSWRLNASHKFLDTFLEKLKEAEPSAPVLLRGDPSWAFSSIMSRGARLSDWTYAIEKGLLDGVVIHTDPKADPSEKRLDRFYQTISSLKHSTKVVWIEGTDEEDRYLKTLTGMLTERGVAVHVAQRLDTQK